MSFFLHSDELALSNVKVVKVNARAAMAGLNGSVRLVVIATETKTEKSDLAGRTVRCG